MKIRNEILEMVRNSTETRREIARQLDVSEASISRYLKENQKNGELTKIVVVKIISNKLNLPETLVIE